MSEIWEFENETYVKADGDIFPMNSHDTAKAYLSLRAEVDRLTTENATLRAALEQYADENNWAGFTEDDTWFKSGAGWVLASEALAAIEVKP
jgi:hypothetical protein